MAKALMNRVTLLALPLLVLGCADTTAPEPRGMTITGTVVDEYSIPQSGISVFIPGREVVVTDASGHFSIERVTAPYDLYAGLSLERGALAYVGLTRNEITVTIPANEFSGWPYGASLSGSIGNGFTGFDWLGTAVLFESPETSHGSVEANHFYDLGVGWRGPEETVGTLHALQWRIPEGTTQVDSFRYGQRTDLALSPGSSLSGLDVRLSPVPLGALGGAVFPAEGYTATRTTLTAGFLGTGSRTGWQIGPPVESSATFAFVTPDLQSARFAVTARAVSGEAWSEAVVSDLAANAVGVSVDIPPAPVLRTPEAGFFEVDHSTRFAWSRTGDAVYLLAIRYADDRSIIPAPPNVYILTTDTTATIPDLGPMRMPFYRDLAYVWEVWAYAPIHSMDDIMGERWFLPDIDGSAGFSGSRPFRFVR